MDMVADRFGRVEEENAKLRKDLDRRAPALFLLPHSRYMQFNDGHVLEWTLFSNALDNTYDCSAINDPTMAKGGHVSPLDEAHWNALVSPTSFPLSILLVPEEHRLQEDYTSGEHPVQGTSVDGPVLLRDLVRAVKIMMPAAVNDSEESALSMRCWAGLVNGERHPVDGGRVDRLLEYEGFGLHMVFHHPLSRHCAEH